MNRIFILFISVFSCCCFSATAQQVIIVNGGTFGTSNYANLGVYNSTNQSYIALDTVEVTSVQDVIVEQDRYVYLAAQDSIVKYDLFSGDRIAIGGFGAPSTIKLGIYNNKLLVGNWYGATSGNLRIFDKNSLAFQDSIPEITKGAKDFVIIGDYAYVSQNNQVNFRDTVGYLATVNLQNNTFVQYDTLSSNGDELGRLVNVGDSVVYSLNGRSNTISSYHTVNGTRNTATTAVDLQPNNTGKAIYFNGSSWYIAFDNGIGLYDLVNNSVINSGIVPLPPSYAFAVDTLEEIIYTTSINYVTQTSNVGVIYSYTGDTTGYYPVGLSPELLAVWNSNVTVHTHQEAAPQAFTVQLFPNPVATTLNINSDLPMSQIFLFDLSGRLVAQRSVNATLSYPLPVQQLAAGTYILRIQTAEGWQTSKFIKE